MLESLIIKNYALIDDLNLKFTPGLTIVTGETGAGKSIMLDALSLLLGERAETKAISDKSRKSVIEATFSSPSPELSKLLTDNGIEWNSAELIARREISASGRSRAFVNDTPVTLPVLSSITSNLIDIHSQHSNMVLSQSSSHLSIIDSFAGDAELLGRYRREFSEYVALRSKIKRIKEQIAKNKENREFIVFQLEQLDKLKPRKGELRQVEQEFDMLSDSDQIREDLGYAYNCFESGDRSINALLAEATESILKVNLDIFGDKVEEELAERLENLRIELKDITETVYDYLERVDSDPGRLAKVTARMNQIYDAIKRFKVMDEDGLVALHAELRGKLDSIDNGDGDLEEMEKQARTLAKDLKTLALELTGIRQEASVRLSELITETARPLGLQNLRFSVALTQGKLTADGQDTADFICSFNKNHEMQSMGKVASGGELARLMLSLKSIMAKCMNLPTVIFDEVDTGVSGEIADKMGDMMRRMGREMQVLAITHLPQVASKGDSHFKVYKTDNETRTVSHVRMLDKEERIRELAAMLSGKTINDAALLNARTLLKNVGKEQK
ncbi:DNA repair protein RecN [Lepagella muris]|jgi:DNA repair protein RecN (Recombination protein N)|uniref:DNA repair protein RecN n=1 Tax=Lepagella muris TaxID=3032870 RepID=A0AC61RG72_9BACT|nr:DNA repair protein RecN [Lepagella muris]ROT03991.1 DNA repair protein RecN [Muribaculaceae bacterium Isolate-037 (Harlan)]TGY78433.1 DNA repair protein RecN [Lepagella muris]THG53645.1 DNA repair protein RecN [Bacteroidales bacterium]TKC66150.1 DNA repair protein RecN [Bacteroidales bacterium]